MPDFVSPTEWHELFAKEPKSSPLYRLLFIAEQWMNAMEKLGVASYDAALQQVPGVESLSVGDIGELFVICLQHWKQGERLVEIATLVEQKLVRENLVIKMSTMSDIARQQGQKFSSQ